MARIRTVKPGYPRHPKVRKVSRDARLLNIHLWNFADDEGRLQELPNSLIGDIFPTDSDVTVVILEGWLTELAEAGLIVRYEVAGENYIQCHDFTEHQVINKAKPSEIPPADAESAGSRTDTVEVRERSRPEREEEKEGEREEEKEWKGKEPPTVPAAADVPTTDIATVFDYWKHRLGKDRARLTPARRDKIRARLKDGTTIAEIRQAIDGCASSEFHVANGHTDLELILRSRENVEKFIGRLTAPGPRSKDQVGMDNARMWAAEAKRLEALERQETAV